jgi:membrane protein DedA with SNARE-associated domain
VKAVAAGVAIILATEAGVPVPVPADVVLLGLGERAGADVLPLWAVMLWLEVVLIVGTSVLLLVARRFGDRLLSRMSARRPSLGARVDRVRGLLERRGTVGLVAGRTTPGLRTLTVLVAALSTIPVAVALAALVAGGTVFVQGHVLLGYAFGPAARAALEDVPVLAIAVGVLLVAAGFGVWLARRGRAGARGWIEGACPACVAIGALDRLGPSASRRDPDAVDRAARGSASWY